MNSIILIIMIMSAGWQGGASVTTIEMSSLVTCQTAVKVIAQKNTTLHNFNVTAICVEK